MFSLKRTPLLALFLSMMFLPGAFSAGPSLGAVSREGGSPECSCHGDLSSKGGSLAAVSLEAVFPQDAPDDVSLDRDSILFRIHELKQKIPRDFFRELLGPVWLCLAQGCFCLLYMSSG